MKKVNKVTYALLGILLGGLGVNKFYAGSVIILVVSSILIRLRKWRADVLSDLGAGVILFAAFWTAGITFQGFYAPQKNIQRDLHIQMSSGWVEAYRMSDKIFVTVLPHFIF